MKSGVTAISAAVGILLICGVIFFTKLTSDPVVRLEIVRQFFEMKTGETIHLEIVGYTKSGKKTSLEQMEALDLLWSVRFGGVCTVDENGLVTAVGTGTDNIQVYSEGEELYSRPIPFL